MHETGRTPCAWPAGRAIFEKEESHRHRRGGWKTREGRGDETVRHRSYTSRPSGEDKGTVLLSSATIVPCPIRELLLRFTRCNNIFSRVPPPPPSLSSRRESANLCRAALNGSRKEARGHRNNGVVPRVTTPRGLSSPLTFSLSSSNCARAIR